MSETTVYGPKQLAKELKKLSRKYPFVSYGSIGSSITGKPIPYLRLGEGAFRWHFNGACHANEWITALLLMRFADDYAKSYERKLPFWGKSAKDLFSRTTLWIVPMLNPDGVELVQQSLTPEHPYYEDLLLWNRGSNRFHRWKANARGVDLNDQFPAHWEEERERRAIPGPAPRDYGGEKPLSEPEALALAEFTEQNDFHAVLALHTQGEEIYWNYRGEEPEESRRWANRLAVASGYRAVYLEGSDAGYKDWFISRFRRPGFTVEAGWGHNPLSLDNIDELYDDIARLLAEALDCAPY
ncbi:M14 family metallopeptidase [Cohnella terricola]|uniref:Peptidase M14 n=1 Tax=Cohnella terricola TaxID=1289167 RepID=A0A559JKM8_9BACL|nr:M14 family metallocarboxypeptidase [Cohnella terricola]TVY00415.1 peptidase M14 [Cohnella terricola]